VAKKKKETGLGADALFQPMKDAAKKPELKKPTPPKEPEKTPKPEPKFKRKTYLMTDELITRIEAIAEAENVGINELHRYLVDLALTQIEDGTHKLKTHSTRRRTLGA